MKKLSLAIPAIALLAACTSTKKTATTQETPTATTTTTATAPAAPSAVSTEFKTSETGLEYRFVKDVPGTQTPKLGDHVEMHIRTYVGDSVLFESRKLNNDQPVPFQIMAPSFKGDLVEGFMMMTPGDSAIFRVSIDSLKNAGAQLLPWMSSGDKLVYEVNLVSVKSEAELKQEQEQHADNQKAADDKILQDYFKKNNLKPLKTASGLYYLISKQGTGALPKPGQYVTVNYTGKTIDGKVFDSNVDPQFNHVQPFSFQLGQGQVIRGWDEGVALLKKGSKATLFIPSGLAYGSRGAGGAIPADAVLIFDVEVTDISDSAPAPALPPGHSEHDGHNH